MTSPRAKPLVLHIDDSNLILAVTKLILGKLGCDVAVAKNGAEGLTAAKERKPDLILLDTNMPDLDGLAVCGKLKADPETAAIPVIMASGDENAQDVANAKAAGAVGYILKPISADRLKEILAAHVRLAQDG